MDPIEEISELATTLHELAKRHKIDLDRLKSTIENTTNIGLEQLKKTMSVITDWAAKEQADLSTVSGTLDGVVTNIAALNAQIAAFNNSPGTLAPADQAALDSIQAASAALVTKAAALVVAVPAPVAIAVKP
jgi:hypothetical protein